VAAADELQRTAADAADDVEFADAVGDLGAGDREIAWNRRNSSGRTLM